VAIVSYHAMGHIITSTVLSTFFPQPPWPIATFSSSTQALTWPQLMRTIYIQPHPGRTRFSYCSFFARCYIFIDYVKLSFPTGPAQCSHENNGKLW
jgi:hypothetical protein